MHGCRSEGSQACARTKSLGLFPASNHAKAAAGIQGALSVTSATQSRYKVFPDGLYQEGRAAEGEETTPVHH